jgi:hypothetical protein
MTVNGPCRAFFITTSLGPYDNMYFERLDKLMSEPVEIPNWLLFIYESQLRFRQPSVKQMITDFVKGCVAVGKTFQASSTGHHHTKDLIGIRINPEPALVKRESGQGIIARVSRLAAYHVGG